MESSIATIAAILNNSGKIITQERMPKILEFSNS
jgi:hypothetical protein